MRAEAVVRLAAVSKSFRGPATTTPVLRDVDLVLTPGAKVSLVGSSGSGKSTLLSLIAGLLRPDEGVVAIEGIATAALDDAGRSQVRASRVGIALQADNLIPFLTARENVELAIGFGGRVARAASRARASELLDRFGVAHRAEHRPGQLSGGEAQRVALAVALANDPAVLLADEVVAGLDARTSALVIQELLAADPAVLYVTHDLAIADLADVRYELADMRVVAR